MVNRVLIKWCRLDIYILTITEAKFSFRITPIIIILLYYLFLCTVSSEYVSIMRSENLLMMVASLSCDVEFLGHCSIKISIYLMNSHSYLGFANHLCQHCALVILTSIQKGLG